MYSAEAASLYQTGGTFTAPLPGIAPSVWRAQRGLANPYAETASLGVEHQLPAQWTVSAEYRFAHGVKLGRTTNSNLARPVLLTAQNASSLRIPAPTPQQLRRMVFSPLRLNPAYDAIHQFQTEAGSDYNGATLTVNRQFTEEFELMAGYTFSTTIDDASSDTRFLSADSLHDRKNEIPGDGHERRRLGFLSLAGAHQGWDQHRSLLK